MGYYYRFEIFATLRRDTPEDIINTIFHCIYGAEGSIDRIAPYSLRDIYKKRLATSKELVLETFRHKLFSSERGHGFRIFHHFNGCSHPYIQPNWRCYSKFADNPNNYKPYWDVRLSGDLNYGYDAIHEVVDFLGPYIAGHRPKKYVGWYKGEDQTLRINLYYSPNK